MTPEATGSAPAPLAPPSHLLAALLHLHLHVIFLLLSRINLRMQLFAKFLGGQAAGWVTTLTLEDPCPLPVLTHQA